MSAAAAKSPMRTESQTGKKKKAKADASDNNSVANSATPSANAEPGAGTNAGEGPNSFEGKEYQSPYVRDLHKYGVLPGKDAATIALAACLVN